MESATMQTFEYLAALNSALCKNRNILKEHSDTLFEVSELVYLHNIFSANLFNPQDPLICIGKIDLPEFKHSNLKHLQLWLDFDVQNPHAHPAFKEFLILPNSSARKQIAKLEEKVNKFARKIEQADSSLQKLDFKTKQRECEQEILRIQNCHKYLFQQEFSEQYATEFLHNWQKWADQGKIILQNNKAFHKLFNAYQLLNMDGSINALRCVHALVTVTVNDMDCCLPLLYSDLQMHFDSNRGLFEIKPVAVDYKLNTCGLEDWLTSKQEPPTVNALTLAKNLFLPEMRRNALYHTAKLFKITPPVSALNEVVNIQELEYSANPRIYEVGVLITENTLPQSQQKDYEAILSNKYDSIPPTIQELLSSTPERDNNSETIWNGEIFFPLNSNHEQRQVLNKLTGSSLAVLQGPPGTGKSHTLLNLLAHFVVTGKTVLLTAPTDKSIRVIERMLTDKLPNFHDFCMILTGQNKAETTELLSMRVAKMHDQLTREDPKIITQILVKYQSELFELRTNINNIIQQIHSISENEFVADRFIKENFTIADLSTQIEEGRPLYEWFIDDVSDLQNELDRTNSEITSAFKRIIEYTPDVLNMHSAYFPSLQQLYNFKKYLNFPQQLAVLRNEYLHSDITEDTPPPTAQDLYSYLDTVDVINDCVHNIENPHILKLLQENQLATSNLTVWQEMLYQLRLDIELLLEASAQTTLHKVVGLCGTYQSVLNDLQSYKTRLRNNSLGVFAKYVTARDLRYLMDEVQMDGEPLQTTDQVDSLIKYLHLQKKLDTLMEDWNASALKDIFIIENSEQIDLLELGNIIKQIQLVITLRMGNMHHLASSVENRFEYLNHLQPAELSKLQFALRYYASTADINDFSNHYQVIKQYFVDGATQPNAHSSWERFATAFESADSVAYHTEYVNLEQLLILLENFQYVQADYQYLMEFIPQILTILDTPNKRRAFILHNPLWHEAYNYKKTFIFMQNYLRDNNIRLLYEHYIQLKNKELSLLNDIILTQAFARRVIYCQENSEKILEQLKRNINNKDWEKTLENFLPLFPVWIMSASEICEKLQPKQLFDVLLVDEGSRSSILSLNILMRANQAVIVGDDKQLTPLTTLSPRVIQQTAKQHLQEIHLAPQLNPNNSLYDIAYNAVGNNRIILKEHFRSVAEIITFSNREFYDNIIQPLKIRTRKAPAINLYKVDKPILQGNLPDVNVAEAHAIVDKIHKMLADESYQGLSMGVISLTEAPQAEYITKVLQQTLDAQDIIGRRLICGTPDSFQGDERDIIFISIGINPTYTPVALTSLRDAQSINVAFTRAREEIHVFRSLSIQKLDKNCLRYKLLDYCRNHKKFKKEVFVTAIAAAKSTSAIKQALALELTQRGHKVKIDRVITEKLCADLIVGGKSNRLIIDCSGFLDNYEEHIQRKLCLERIGWRYFHLLPSEWHFKSQDVLQQIEQLLVRT